MANLTVSKADERKVMEAMNECRDKIMEIESKTSHPTRVIAISNNLITLAKPPGERAQI
jgi:hypothetical protein